MSADLTALAGATIAFDLDGTLVDTAPDLVGTLNVLLAQEGLTPLPLEIGRPMIGRGAKALIQRGFDAAGVALTEARLEALFGRFLIHYDAHIAVHSRPFEGVVTALETLRAAGARLAVCTNKRTDLSRHLLAELKLDGHFDAIVGPDAAGCQKPDPRHLVFTVEAAGGQADSVIMVGDAATDAGAAKGAGAGLILVSFGYTETPVAELGADILIDHFDELTRACVALVERRADAG